MSDMGQWCYDLERHITQCLMEEVAEVNGDGQARYLHPTCRDVLDVDQDVTEGPVVLVRRGDGARFLVDVDVTVTSGDKE